MLHIIYDIYMYVLHILCIVSHSYLVYWLYIIQHVYFGKLC